MTMWNVHVSTRSYTIVHVHGTRSKHGSPALGPWPFIFGRCCGASPPRGVGRAARGRPSQARAPRPPGGWRSYSVLRGGCRPRQAFGAEDFPVALWWAIGVGPAGARRAGPYAGRLARTSGHTPLARTVSPLLARASACLVARARARACALAACVFCAARARARVCCVLRARRSLAIGFPSPHLAPRSCHGGG